MAAFRIPSRLHIGRDVYGRLEATESNYESIATITINYREGVLGGCTAEEYLANLRRRALEAYRNGQTEIDA